MRAAVAYEGEEQLRLENIAIPRIGPDDVLVRVKATGVSRGTLFLWKRQRGLKILPSVLGSYIAGVIAEVGAEVRGFKEGDRVRVHGILTCRDCYYCRTDQETLCPSFANMGHSVQGEAGMTLFERYHNGGLAEYVKAPAWNVDVLPDEIPFDVGSRIGSLAVGFRAIKLAQPSFGGTLIITAASGAAGRAAVKCAPLFGVTRVIAVARRRAALERAKTLEPDLVQVMPLEELPGGWEEEGLLTERLRSLAGGPGADAMVDFTPTGSQVTVQALFAMRKGGRAILLGGNMSALEIPYMEFMQQGYQVRGHYGIVRRDTQELTELLRMRRLSVSDLITHRFSLEEANRALEVIENRVGDPGWVVISP